MLLLHPASRLLLSAAYGDTANSGAAQCQSSDTLNKEAKGLIQRDLELELELPQNLIIRHDDKTGMFTTNMRSAPNIIFELYAQSEVGQGEGWPALKTAAIAAYEERMAAARAAGGGGGGGGR